MNILSLFDGMSCAQIALNRVGANIDNYYASEIDKYAIQVTQKNYPDTIQLGDITKIKGRDLPKIDLLIGGSPCQGFSFAGKQLNFQDERSKLFFEFVRIFKEVKPRYFLLENVRMLPEHENVITELLGVKPYLINSALVSAQNRERLYWTNIKIDNLPQDKGVLLKDVVNGAISDKSKTIRVGGRSYSSSSDKKFILENLKSINSRVEDITIDEDGIRPNRGDKRKSGVSELGRLLFESAKKTYTLTVAHVPKLYTPVNENNWRKLTTVECERLQTVPDNYTEGISNSQRYKMLGNGFTVDIICHFLKQFGKFDLNIEIKKGMQLALF